MLRLTQKRLELVGTLEDPDLQYRVETIAFDPANPRVLASALRAEDGPAGEQIRLWDLGTGKLAQTLKSDQTRFENLAYSPNGKFMAAAEGRKPCVLLWDMNKSALARTLIGGRVYAPPVAFSPDSHMLAVGGSDYGLVYVYNSETGERVKILKYEGGDVSGLAFSNDGEHLVAVHEYYGGQIRVWNAHTWTRVRDLNPDVRGGAHMGSPFLRTEELW